MNGVAIAVIAIIAAFAFKGHRIGFIKTVFSMFSIILVLFLTTAINPYINKILQNNEKVNSIIKTNVSNVFYENKEKEENKKLTQQRKFIEEMPVPDSIKRALIENNNEDVHKVLEVTNFNDYVVSYLTRIVINAISYGITFIILSIILSIIVFTLNIISKLPILNGLNKTAGLILGVVEGFIVIWILCIVLTMFSTSKAGQAIYIMINESVFLSTIYNNNYLLKFIINISNNLF